MGVRLLPFLLEPVCKMCSNLHFSFLKGHKWSLAVLLCPIGPSWFGPWGPSRPLIPDRCGRYMYKCPIKWWYKISWLADFEIQPFLLTLLWTFDFSQFEIWESPKLSFSKLNFNLWNITLIQILSNTTSLIGFKVS